MGRISDYYHTVKDKAISGGTRTERLFDFYNNTFGYRDRYHSFYKTSSPGNQTTGHTNSVPQNRLSLSMPTDPVIGHNVLEELFFFKKNNTFYE
jgi:hypothetical protein